MQSRNNKFPAFVCRDLSTDFDFIGPSTPIHRLFSWFDLSDRFYLVLFLSRLSFFLLFDRWSLIVCPPIFAVSRRLCLIPHTFQYVHQPKQHYHCSIITLPLSICQRYPTLHVFHSQELYLLPSWGHYRIHLLTLNSAKTEFILIGLPQQLSKNT